MDPAVYGPGPVNSNLLTLQNEHRSEAVWNRREAPEDLRVRSNFGEYWNTVKDNWPHDSIVTAITAAGFGWIFRLGKEEQLLEVDSAAPDLNRAQSLLQGVIARVRGRRPVTPVEPEPGTYYTHVASSSSGMGSWSHHVGTSTAPDRDARGPSGAGEWPRWPDVPTKTAGDDYVGGEGGFAVNLEDDEDTSATGGHTHVSPPLQESYKFLDRDVYRPDVSFLADQYTTPPLQAPVPSFGVYPARNFNGSWGDYRRLVIEAVGLIREENNRMLLRRCRFYMLKLVKDSAAASGREMTFEEECQLLQNPNYLSDEPMSDEEATDDDDSE
ncbi:hypothetical protein ACET3Z_031827 [Daucus carota]